MVQQIHFKEDKFQRFYNIVVLQHTQKQDENIPKPGLCMWQRTQMNLMQLMMVAYLEDVRSCPCDTTGNGLDKARHFSHDVDTV